MPTRKKTSKSSEHPTGSNDQISLFSLQDSDQLEPELLTEAPSDTAPSLYESKVYQRFMNRFKTAKKAKESAKLAEPGSDIFSAVNVKDSHYYADSGDSQRNYEARVKSVNAAHSKLFSSHHPESALQGREFSPSSEALSASQSIVKSYPFTPSQYESQSSSFSMYASDNSLQLYLGPEPLLEEEPRTPAPLLIAPQLDSRFLPQSVSSSPFLWQFQDNSKISEAEARSESISDQSSLSFSDSDSLHLFESEKGISESVSYSDSAQLSRSEETSLLKGHLSYSDSMELLSAIHLSNAESASESLCQYQSTNLSASTSVSDQDSTLTVVAESLSQFEFEENSIFESLLTFSDSIQLSESEEDLSESLSGSNSLRLFESKKGTSESVSNSDYTRLSESEETSLMESHLSHSESVDLLGAIHLSNAESASESLYQYRSTNLSASTSVSDQDSTLTVVTESLSQLEFEENSIFESLLRSSESALFSEELSGLEDISESVSYSDFAQLSQSEKEFSESISDSGSLRLFESEKSVSESISYSDSMDLSESEEISLLENQLSHSESLFFSADFLDLDNLSESVSTIESMRMSEANDASLSERLLDKSESLFFSADLSNLNRLSDSTSVFESTSLSESEVTSLSEGLLLSHSESLFFSEDLSDLDRVSESVSILESMRLLASQTIYHSESLAFSEKLHISESVSYFQPISESLSDSESGELSEKESYTGSVSLSDSVRDSIAFSLVDSTFLSQSDWNLVAASLENSESIEASHSDSQSEYLETVAISGSLSETLSLFHSTTDSISESCSLVDSQSESSSLSEEMGYQASEEESLLNFGSAYESQSLAFSESVSLFLEGTADGYYEVLRSEARFRPAPDSTHIVHSEKLLTSDSVTPLGLTRKRIAKVHPNLLSDFYSQIESKNFLTSSELFDSRPVSSMLVESRGTLEFRNFPLPERSLPSDRLSGSAFSGVSMSQSVPHSLLTIKWGRVSESVAFSNSCSESESLQSAEFL